MSTQASKSPPIIGGFQIVSKLGQGAMGTVFKAHQISLDRYVALKVLPPKIARKDPVFVDRFIREARVVARLNHPNIVQGIEVGKDEATGLYYFAMEYIDGPTVKKILTREKVIEEARALKIVRDVALALERANESGIVHRDIKPDNILIGSRGETKLADLGLAKRIADEKEDLLSEHKIEGPDVNAELTTIGKALGTPYYMAPEQVTGETAKIDIRTDIYALGATLFHMVTGRPPFKGEDSKQVMCARLKQPVPNPLEFNERLSNETCELIMRCMALQREERLQTPMALVDAIDEALSNQTSLDEQQSSSIRETRLIGSPTKRKTSQISTGTSARLRRNMQNIQEHEIHKPEPVRNEAPAVNANALAAPTPEPDCARPTLHSKTLPDKKPDAPAHEALLNVETLPFLEVEAPRVGVEAAALVEKSKPLQPTVKPLRNKIDTTPIETKNASTGRLGILVGIAVLIGASVGTIHLLQHHLKPNEVATTAIKELLPPESTDVLAVEILSPALSEASTRLSPLQAEQPDQAAHRTTQPPLAETLEESAMPQPNPPLEFKPPVTDVVESVSVNVVETSSTHSQKSENAIAPPTPSETPMPPEQPIIIAAIDPVKPNAVVEKPPLELAADLWAVPLQQLDAPGCYDAIQQVVNERGLDETEHRALAVHLSSLYNERLQIQIQKILDLIDEEKFDEAEALLAGIRIVVGPDLPALKNAQLLVETANAQLADARHLKTVAPEKIGSTKIPEAVLSATKPQEVPPPVPGDIIRKDMSIGVQPAVRLVQENQHAAIVDLDTATDSTSSIERTKTTSPKISEAAKRILPVTPTEVPKSAESAAKGAELAITLGTRRMPLVRIPAGSFTMGKATLAIKGVDEVEVTLTRDFYIGKFQVTQGQYQAVTGQNPSRFEGDDIPVHRVSWEEAVAFCRSASLMTGYLVQLPTEAQWEYACKAGATTNYYTGDDASALDRAGWWQNNSGSRIQPIGRKTPNAWGLHDMHGNVWEWCRDWKGEYPRSAVVDPQGPPSGTERILRGGSFNAPATFSNAAFRFALTPNRAVTELGFRVTIPCDAHGMPEKFRKP